MSGQQQPTQLYLTNQLKLVCKSRAVTKPTNAELFIRIEQLTRLTRNQTIIRTTNPQLTWSDKELAFDELY